MRTKNKQTGIEPRDMSDDEYERMQTRMSAARMATGPDNVVLAVNRIIDGLDIDIETLSKGATAALTLGLDKLQDIIAETSDDNIRIKAINTAVSIANHVIRRRELAMEEGGSITVHVNANHVPPALAEIAANNSSDGEQHGH